MKNLILMFSFITLALVSNAQIINVNEMNIQGQTETTIYCDIESHHFLGTFTDPETKFLQ